MDTKTQVGLGLTIIAVFLLVMSISFPWYTWQQDSTYSKERTYRVYLDEDSDNNYYGDQPQNTTSVFDNTMLMFRMGVVSTILSVFMIGAATYSDKKEFSKIGAVLLVAAIIFTILAPIYLMTTLPGAYKDDMFSNNEELPNHDSPAKSFIGDYESDENNHEEDWGAGIGWYFSFISGGLLAVALLLVLLGGKKTKQYENSEAQNRYPTYQQGQRQQPQQQYDQSRQQPQQQYDQSRQQPQQQYD